MFWLERLYCKIKGNETMKPSKREEKEENLPDEPIDVTLEPAHEDVVKAYEKFSEAINNKNNKNKENE